jgi:hypothetical protein
MEPPRAKNLKARALKWHDFPTGSKKAMGVFAQDPICTLKPG